MTTIDTLEPKVEKLIERIRSLNFTFHDSELQQSADNSKEEIIELLEGWIELATEDWENRPQTEQADEENS